MHVASARSSLNTAIQTPLGEEVYRGLTGHPKSLCPWLFYDEKGSALFEQITALPEYYVTRTERAILADYADEIISTAADRRLTLVELGAGTATKTGLLLDAALRHQQRVTYHPIDVSESALNEAKLRIETRLPGVTVKPRVADYTEGLGAIDAAGQRRLVLFIGSSIGNFEPADALQLLRGLRQQLQAGDRLLLGVDRIKERNLLLAAYDDKAGVTAAFNLNVLERLNRELGANFNLRLFRHCARWSEEHSRIEMHLESLVSQQIFIPALELEVKLNRGETIHTENSYKFTPEGLASLLERSGFKPSRQWTDERNWFSVFLATAW